MQFFYYYLFIFSLAILTRDCKHQQKQIENQKESIISETEITEKLPEIPTTLCSKDGKCTAVLKPNTTFSLAEDSIDALYPVWYTEQEKASFVFTYERNKNSEYADNEYKEEVYLTFDPNRDYMLKDTELQQIKLTYGRICFCRGATGYVPVTKGQAEIKKLGSGTYKIVLQFKNEAYPQLIEKIEDTLSLTSQN